jgi:hypothetical protein
LDEATERRIKQIEVSKMPASELDEILKNGERELGISFEGFCRERILAYSDGFPYYTHLFALHTSRRALADGRAHVTLEDFESALDEILADTALSLRKTYDAAVETSGEVQTRKSIMEAIASVNETEVSFKRIREAFLEIHPKYGDAKNLNFLSYAMKPLKDEYGILVDKGKPRSANNTYSFKNPLMRAYIRLRALKEGQGVIAMVSAAKSGDRHACAHASAQASATRTSGS